MWAQLSFVLTQMTCLTNGREDRQADRQTAFSWLDRAACNTCPAVKVIPNYSITGNYFLLDQLRVSYRVLGCSSYS